MLMREGLFWNLAQILIKIYFKTEFLAFVTYPISISCFECEITPNFSQQKSTLV